MADAESQFLMKFASSFMQGTSYKTKLWKHGCVLNSKRVVHADEVRVKYS